MSISKKLYCNTCENETNHKFFTESNREYAEFADEEERHIIFHERFKYKFWVCLGCDTALIQEVYSHSGMRDYEGNDIYEYTYYPERTNVFKREAKKFIHIDENLKSTYNEIIKANNMNLAIVSTMGIRALLEGICIVEKIDDKKAYALNKKIELLETESNIPKSITDGLKSLKFIGDDAAHRLIKTSTQNISLAIDLIEALLTQLYESKYDLELKAKRVCEAKIQAHNKT